MFRFEGLFRVSPSHIELNAVRRAVEAGDLGVILDDSVDVHAVTSLGSWSKIFEIHLNFNFFSFR